MIHVLCMHQLCTKCAFCFRIVELRNEIAGLREANRNLEQNLIEATTTNQVRIRF